MTPELTTVWLLGIATLALAFAAIQYLAIVLNSKR